MVQFKSRKKGLGGGEILTLRSQAIVLALSCPKLCFHFFPASVSFMKLLQHSEARLALKMLPKQPVVLMRYAALSTVQQLSLLLAFHSSVPLPQLSWEPHVSLHLLPVMQLEGHADAHSPFLVAAGYHSVTIEKSLTMVSEFCKNSFHYYPKEKRSVLTSFMSI